MSKLYPKKKENKYQARKSLQLPSRLPLVKQDRLTAKEAERLLIPVVLFSYGKKAVIGYI